MIRGWPVDPRPKRVTCAGSRGTDIGVAVMPVNAPGMQDPLVVEKLMAGPPDVVHDLVAPLFLQRFAHSAGDVVEHFVPANLLPCPLASFAYAFQRITNTLWIRHLVER